VKPSSCPAPNPRPGRIRKRCRVDDWVFIAGQGPVDPVTQEAVLGTIESETRLAMDHIKQLLELAGSSLQEVVKVTVHLADINDFDAFNAIYRRYFQTPPRPARITCQSGLWGGIKIEVECTAYSPRRQAFARRVSGRRQRTLPRLRKD